MALVAASLLFTSTAGAYCRTTTCDPTKTTCAVNEAGCVRAGAPLTWSSLPIQYRFSIGSTKVENVPAKKAIRAAFETWQTTECANGKRTSLRFQELAQTSTVKALKDSGRAEVPFAIYFRDEEWPHQNADESLALTNQIYGEVTGTIEYADIEINTTDQTFATADDITPNAIDLQLVMTHEVGHYIGLAHTEQTESIMVARYCQSGDRCATGQVVSRDLSPDDITAVCALYPPDGKSIATGASDTPASGCNTSGVPGSGFGACALAFGVAVAVRRLRRRNQG